MLKSFVSQPILRIGGCIDDFMDYSINKGDLSWLSFCNFSRSGQPPGPQSAFLSRVMSRIKALAAAGICLGTGSCSAADIWPAEGFYQAAALGDMLTTLDIQHHPYDQESNPILGKHPSDSKVIGYFVLTSLGHFLITQGLVNHGLIKSAWIWEGSTISLELYWTQHNRMTGLSFRF